MDVSWWFYILIGLVAFLYAAVGHGGASGYLAVMALVGMAPSFMRPTALVLNLFVSLVAFWQYYSAQHFQWRLIWPFLISSIPLAFLGGSIDIEILLYKKLLGLILLIPILRFVFQKNSDSRTNSIPSIWVAIGFGSVIGFLSGLLGIGGGILLSPILLLFNWADQKKAAAVSALFIFINSLAGLLGQYNSGLTFSNEMIGIIATAFIAGTIGSFLGAKKFENELLKKILIGVLLLAAAKLLFTN